MNSLQLAKKINSLVQDVKAIDPLILDLKDISSIADYFVICAASSDRQTRAIADKVELELKKENIRPHSAEGYELGTWVIIDYFDVVLHVFTEELRKEYDLEGFWEKAKKLKVAAPKRLKTTKASKAPQAPKAIKKPATKKKVKSNS